MKSRNEINKNLFYCEHLFDRNNITRELQNSFYIEQKSGIGLEIYLKVYSESDEVRNENRTYIVRDTNTDEVAGYFSLKAGLFSIREIKETSYEGEMAQFETLPGIELSAFAVNQKYIADHPNKKGCGTVIFFGLIMPLVKQVQETIGVKVIYIFALPQQRLIDTYANEYGFRRLDKCDEENLHKRLKPRFDHGCIFMYQLI